MVVVIYTSSSAGHINRYKHFYLSHCAIMRYVFLIIAYRAFIKKDGTSLLQPAPSEGKLTYQPTHIL